MVKKVVLFGVLLCFLASNSVALEWDSGWTSIDDPTHYTAATLSDLQIVADAHDAFYEANSGGSYELENISINGFKFSIYTTEDPETSEWIYYFFVDEQFYAVLTESEDLYFSPEDGDFRWSENADLIAILKALHISYLTSTVSGIGGGDEASAYTSPAGVTSRLVMQNLVIPAAKTRAEKAKEDAQKTLKKARTLGAAAAWEDVKFSDGVETGDIYGANIGMAWDNENISYGFMLPYDYLDFDNFDANRIGLIGFGQYKLSLSGELSAAFTGHLNYTYTDMDFAGIGHESVNVYGGGLSASATYDSDMFVVSAGASYLYNTDDTDAKDDEQHLLKFGFNTGVRNGDDGVFNVFAVWNIDVTNYENDPQDDDYFEVGMEGSYTFSDTFGLTLGYKKVIELQDFDADQIYLGSSWKF